MSDRPRNTAEEAGWDLLVDGLLRTDFGREIDAAQLIATAERRARKSDGRVVFATWAAVLLLSLGAALLGAGLGSQTALQSERLTRVALHQHDAPVDEARPTGDSYPGDRP